MISYAKGGVAYIFQLLTPLTMVCRSILKDDVFGNIGLVDVRSADFFGKKIQLHCNNPSRLIFLDNVGELFFAIDDINSFDPKENRCEKSDISDYQFSKSKRFKVLVEHISRLAIHCHEQKKNYQKRKRKRFFIHWTRLFLRIFADLS